MLMTPLWRARWKRARGEEKNGWEAQRERERNQNTRREGGGNWKLEKKTREIKVR